LYISIAEPCHEDWNEMSPVEQGRHCAVCQKNVVDFTEKNDEDILDFFKNYNGSACGRFMDEQLNRPLSKIEIKPASNFLKYAASLLLPFTFFTSKTNAQKGRVVIKGDTISKIANLKTLPGENFSNQSCDKEVTGILLGGVVSAKKLKESYKDVILITGRIVDAEDGTALAGVTVSLSDGKSSVLTNSEGYFILTKSKQLKDVTVIVTSVGYQKAELDLSNLKKKNNFFDLSTIHLSRQILGLSEVVVTGDSYKRLGGLTRSVSIVKYSFRDTITNIFIPPAVKIFPNPVSTGGTLQLTFGKTKPGIYQIRLLNAAGQLFYSFQKQITSANETEQIHLHERTGAGVYILQITDDKNKLVQSSKIIIQ
jgi:CarboxypepD_reg-like domain/Secretion system C-terminal sorting domain